MDFQQSRTFVNLQIAFEGELVASAKYAIYALKAREEQYIEIGNVFDVTSRNELQHAIIWMKLLNDGQIPDTLTNLVEASESDKYAGSVLYREFAQVAREEGYFEIANLFNGVANIEMNHDARFYALAQNIENNEVFCKNREVLWICMACGNILSGLCAPAICPVCGYPQGYYRVYSDDLVI
jgi:rubrerythrin